MRISTAIPIFVTLAGVNADGARKKRLAKPSKSGSAGSMDAVSSWASAPAPAHASAATPAPTPPMALTHAPASVSAPLITSQDVLLSLVSIGSFDQQMDIF